MKMKTVRTSGVIIFSRHALRFILGILRPWGRPFEGGLLIIFCRALIFISLTAEVPVGDLQEGEDRGQSANALPLYAVLVTFIDKLQQLHVTTIDVPWNVLKEKKPGTDLQYAKGEDSLASIPLFFVNIHVFF